MKPTTRPLFIQITASALAIAISASTAHADWITEKLSETCSGTAFMGKQAANVRQQVEDYVTRNEAAIQPPAPVGDLGCLKELMTGVNLDFFSGMIPNVQSMFGSAFSGMAMGPGGIEGMICSFAQQKWAELTGKLQQGLQGPAAGLQVPDFTSNFGSGNIPGINIGNQAAGNRPDNFDGSITPQPFVTPGVVNSGITPSMLQNWTDQGYRIPPELLKAIGNGNPNINAQQKIWQNMVNPPSYGGNR